MRRCVTALVSLISLLGGVSQVDAVGPIHPVAVTDSVNDGTRPAACGGSNSQAGGIPEVALDLDADGVADICLSSGSTSCSSNFNLDCATATGGSQCSAENSGSNQFMNGQPAVSAKRGDQVGPNFANGSDSVDGQFADKDLVVGFQGSSLYPGRLGYFHLRFNSVDCSISPGNAFFDDGDGLLAYAMPSLLDLDGDGILNEADNCPFAANTDQADADADGVGDACDSADGTDVDGDGVTNEADNCPFAANTDQADADGDGVGDACDSADGTDVDGDGVTNEADNCPFAANTDQADADGDGVGDVCDSSDGTDVDGDGVTNEADNCPFAANTDQADADGDGVGDACDSADGTDVDGDGVTNETDNCPFAANIDQADADGDGVGDDCDSTDGTDLDGDGVLNADDACPFDADPSCTTDGGGCHATGPMSPFAALALLIGLIAATRRRVA